MDDRDRDRGAWARYRDPREREDDRDRYRYYDDRDRISDPGHPSRPPPRWMEEPAARLQQCVLGRLSLLNINISMPALVFCSTSKDFRRPRYAYDDRR